jgi:hypothetical protein
MSTTARTTTRRPAPRTGFAQMLVGRHGERLDTWIVAVEADDQPDLHRFVNGLRRDKAAVRNGLTLPHSVRRDAVLSRAAHHAGLHAPLLGHGVRRGPHGCPADIQRPGRTHHLQAEPAVGVGTSGHPPGQGNVGSRARSPHRTVSPREAPCRRTTASPNDSCSPPPELTDRTLIFGERHRRSAGIGGGPRPTAPRRSLCSRLVVDGRQGLARPEGTTCGGAAHPGLRPRIVRDTATGLLTRGIDGQEHVLARRRVAVRSKRGYAVDAASDPAAVSLSCLWGCHGP